MLETLEWYRRPEPPSRPAVLYEDNIQLAALLNAYRRRRDGASAEAREQWHWFTVWMDGVTRTESRAEGNIALLFSAVRDLESSMERQDHERAKALRSFLRAEYDVGDVPTVRIERNERSAGRAAKRFDVVPEWLRNGELGP